MNPEMKAVQDEIVSTTKGLFDGLNSKFTEFKGEFTEANTRTKTRLDELQALIHRPGLPDSPGAGGPALSKSVWDNSDFQHFAKTCKGRVAIPLEHKTAITSSAVGSSTPGILVPQRVADIVKPGVRRLRVRDLLSTFPTTNNAIEYVKENAFTNAASVQTEASEKGESALTFTIESAPVRTIAHWLPVTRQILSDFSQLSAYVDVRLIDGLKDIEDFELLRATGSGNHITGLIPSATAYQTARNIAGDTKLDTLNHAMAQLEDLEFTADSIVLNPRDWRAIELLKDGASANTGAYLMGGPGAAAPMNVWRAPVATTSAMPAGFFLVGDFRRAAAVYDRMDSIVEVSDSHSDYFTRNMLAIRAEERLALALMQPSALVYGTFV